MGGADSSASDHASYRLGLILELPQLCLEQGQGRVACGLGLGNGQAQLPDPLFPPPDIVPLLQVSHLNLYIGPLPLLHEKGGEQAPFRLSSQLAHEGLGRCALGRPAERAQDGSEPRVSDLLLFKIRQKSDSRLFLMQEHQEEIPLGQARRGPGLGRIRSRRRRCHVGRAVEPALPGPGPLELLGLDPELGRVHPQPPRRLAG